MERNASLLAMQLVPQKKQNFAERGESFLAEKMLNMILGK